MAHRPLASGQAEEAQQQPRMFVSQQAKVAASAGKTQVHSIKVRNTGGPVAGKPHWLVDPVCGTSTDTLQKSNDKCAARETQKSRLTARPSQI